MTLADSVLFLHLLIVLFNLGGLVLVAMGGLRGWQWVRRRGWRVVHVALALVIAVEAWWGIHCPLTVLEDSLRGEASSQTFISRLIAAVMYWNAPPWIFVAAYSLYLLLVLAAWWCWPPQKRT